MWIELRDPPWATEPIQRMVNMKQVYSFAKGLSQVHGTLYTIEFYVGPATSIDNEAIVEYFTEQFARDQRYDQIIRALRSK